MNNRLLIISAFVGEKPIGGVTMHVHRLLKAVVERYVASFEVCDYKKDSFRKQVRKIHKSGVMHIHASNPTLKLFYVIAGKLLGTKSIVTVHGRYGVFGLLKNALHSLALKWCDVPVLINKESYDEVLRLNKNAVFIPAFIPPIQEEEVLPEEVKREVVKFKEAGKFLFLTNASSRAYTDDGKEIYGIDFLISFFCQHLESRLIIQDPRAQYLPYYEEKLPSNVKIITGKHSFCGLVELADFVIRNTPIDGDSFSVKEALYYHKIVLASDAVSRPEGVFLFKYNDRGSLEMAIRVALDYQEEPSLVDEDSVQSYKELYKRMGVLFKL